MNESAAPADPETLLAHGDFVRAVARSLLWDEHAAEDVVQETWLAALGARGATSRGWLGTVAHNLSVKRLRGDRRRVAREALAARPEGVPSDEDVLERERLRRDVVRAVLALDEPYRATILLRYLESLPPREVAKRMGVPVETVRTRTRRALGLLRVRLDARHGGDRRGLCAALAMWGGGRPPGAAIGTAATGGGIVMGTKAIAAGVGVVVLGIAAYLFWPRDTAPPGIETAASPVPPPRPGAALPPPRPAREPQEEAPPPAPPAPAKPVVKGRIVDADGRPAPGMTVWVTGPEVVATDASGKRPSGNSVVLTTDAEGRFETLLPSAAKCTVMPAAHPAFQPKPADRKEVTPPDERVDFVVDRKPTSTLVVTAFDLDEGKPIAQFDCNFGKSLSHAPRVPVDGRVEALVRLAAAAGDTVQVTVTAGGATAVRDVAVRENERVEVRVEIRRGGRVAGRVVDASGRPLAGALVFFGEEDVGRGDEPFKPFDEKRVKDGARTGADGRFELRGTGRWITTWHADASPVTVAQDRAAEVVLPARGAIRGVLRGDGGAPVPSKRVLLDRKRDATTDAEGRFTFTAVEAGSRGLMVEGTKAYVAVSVAPGETRDVDLVPGIAEVRIEWPGRTSFGRFVVLVPLDDVGTLAAAQPDGGPLVVRDVLPGRYVLLAEGGGVATAEVSGPEATAVAGRGEIVVRAKKGMRVVVVPADSGYLVRLMAGRQAGPGAPADGIVRFTGLAPGRYDVGVERGGVRATVEVRDGTVETTIE